MRRRGAWRIGTGGSNCFLSYNHALNHAGLSLSGVVGPDATARRTRQPSAARAAPGRTGLSAGRGAGKAGRRPCASLFAAAQQTAIQVGTCIQREKNFEFRGPRTAPSRQARLDRAVDGSLRFSTLQFTLAVAELIRACSSLSARRAAKSFKRNWVAPHPSQKRRKHKNGVAAPGWRPSSAAAHCPCSSDAARRRGDRGLSLERHC